MLLKEINNNLNVYLHKYANSAAASHSKHNKGLSEDNIIQDMEPDKKERARQLLHSAVQKGVKWTATSLTLSLKGLSKILIYKPC